MRKLLIQFSCFCWSPFNPIYFQEILPSFQPSFSQMSHLRQVVPGAQLDQAPSRGHTAQLLGILPLEPATAIATACVSAPKSTRCPSLNQQVLRDALPSLSRGFQPSHRYCLQTPNSSWKMVQSGNSRRNYVAFLNPCQSRINRGSRWEMSVLLCNSHGPCQKLGRLQCLFMYRIKDISACSYLM